MKRIFLRLPACLLLMFVHLAQAQQSGKTPRIGVLVSGSPQTHGKRVDVFRQTLRELGYTEGKNIIIEYRYGEGKRERFAALAAEMVSLNPDVIYVSSTAFAQAIKKATSTIPIVATAGDLVGSKLVDSLARPGGNLTGSTNISPDVSGKRLELLKEAAPKIARVAVLWHPNRADEDEVKQTENAARLLGITVHSAQARTADEFSAAFAAMKRENADGLVVIQGSLMNSHSKKIAELALANRLPSIGEAPHYATNGCLMSYGPNLNDLWARGAIFVDKILKGAKPAELPAEQPKKFDLLINLKTAERIGLAIPPHVLARADRVIR